MDGVEVSHMAETLFVRGQHSEEEEEEEEEGMDDNDGVSPGARFRFRLESLVNFWESPY